MAYRTSAAKIAENDTDFQDFSVINNRSPENFSRHPLNSKHRLKLDPQYDFCDIISREKEFLSLLSNYNTMAINYLGASDYYAGILCMKSQNLKSLKWVKDSLTFIILQWLKQLLKDEENRK